MQAFFVILLWKLVSKAVTLLTIVLD